MEKTEKEQKKHNRNTTCPVCEQKFFSRKQRHKHQMLVHRGWKESKIRPVAELY